MLIKIFYLYTMRDPIYFLESVDAYNMLNNLIYFLFMKKIYHKIGYKVNLQIYKVNYSTNDVCKKKNWYIILDTFN